MSNPEDDREARRARILAMTPEARADLATLMRRSLDKIPAQITKLQEEQKQLTDWLAEFAPDLAPVQHVSRRLERVRTDDGCYRVLGHGVGTGSITYDPMVENLDISWLPANHPAAGRSAAGIAAGIFDLNGEDALYEHLETLFQQLSNQSGRDCRG
jgi:hypothetical protein